MPYRRPRGHLGGDDVTPDIIAAIDQAVGCQHCGGSLQRSVSDDFCGEGCQQAWHASRVRLAPSGFLLPHEVREQARVAELARQVTRQSWTLANPPQFNSGDRMTIQFLTGPAEVYTYDGQGWFSVGHVSGPVEAVVDEPSPWRRGDSNLDIQGWIDERAWERCIISNQEGT
jgi:hypothetical protein